MTAPMIRVRNLHKAFGGTPVLRGIDLDVGVGEVVCIIGPSGSGKSTFLRCLNHLETPDQGVIEIGGVPAFQDRVNGTYRTHSQRAIAAVRAKVGMVFQSFNLFPHLTALQNVVEAPVHVLRQPAREARNRAGELLAQVGLSDKLDAYPQQLSGGQQQRVAIARALAMDPVAMLFDEATSALDPELVGEVLVVMKDLASRHMTMVVVSHEIGFVRDVATRVAFMDAGMIVEQAESIQMFTNPHEPRTRAFLQRVLSHA